MKLMQLVPDDPSATVCALFEENAQGVSVVRPRYVDLVCPGRRCGKIDEYKALGRGLDESIRILGHRDFLASADDMIIVTEAFRRVTERHGLRGLEFIDLADRAHFVVRPTLVIAVDKAASRMEFRGRACAVCGRYRQTLYAPAMSSIRAPEDPLSVFSTDVRPETRRGRMTTLYVSDWAGSVLEEAGLSGIDWAASRSTQGEGSGSEKSPGPMKSDGW